jgi:hypothetical protein
MHLASRGVRAFFEAIIRTIWLFVWPFVIAIVSATLLVLVATQRLPADFGQRLGVAAAATGVFYLAILLPLLFLVRTVSRRKLPTWGYSLVAIFLSLGAAAYYFRYLSPLPTGVYSFDMILLLIPVVIYGLLVGRGFYRAFDCSEEWG